jgi:predicted YcjX-like family ATPase
VPVFEPSAIDPSPVDGIAHINLDLALEFLLGDRLR